MQSTNAASKKQMLKSGCLKRVLNAVSPRYQERLGMQRTHASSLRSSNDTWMDAACKGRMLAPTKKLHLVSSRGAFCATKRSPIKC